MKQKNIKLNLEVWFGEEWFCPDGVVGFAMPFFLAHNRLMKLEKAMVFEVEGGTPEWCMRLLRHETGHAIDNAFRLRKLKTRQKLFGLSSQEYPEDYSPKPYSRNYIQNIEGWYGQSHPDEDWAETFAVWLNPQSAWKKRYKKWPAIKKIEYVDHVMKSIAGKKPPVTVKDHVGEVSTIRRKLRTHYRAKQDRIGLHADGFFDRELRKIFQERATPPKNGVRATRFIRQERSLIRSQVARWTGQYQYTINDMLDEIIERCQELNLWVSGSTQQTRLDLICMLTFKTMNYLYGGFHRISL